MALVHGILFADKVRKYTRVPLNWKNLLIISYTETVHSVRSNVALFHCIIYVTNVKVTLSIHASYMKQHINFSQKMSS